MKWFYLILLSLSLGTVSADTFIHHASAEEMTIDCPVEACHAISKYGLSGNWILLEDGSKWKTVQCDYDDVITWSIGDVVYITQSNSVLCGYDYMMINFTKKTVVYVNRLVKPTYFGPNSRFIVAIDHESKRLLLNDGTWWSVSEYDERWEENHTLIIGVNSGFDKEDYPFILINVGIDVFDLGLDACVSAQISYE